MYKILLYPLLILVGIILSSLFPVEINGGVIIRWTIESTWLSTLVLTITFIAIYNQSKLMKDNQVMQHAINIYLYQERRYSNGTGNPPVKEIIFKLSHDKSTHYGIAKCSIKVNQQESLNSTGTFYSQEDGSINSYIKIKKALLLSLLKSNNGCLELSVLTTIGHRFTYTFQSTNNIWKVWTEEDTLDMRGKENFELVKKIKA